MLDGGVGLGGLARDLLGGGQVSTIPAAAERLHQLDRIHHLLHLQGDQGLLIGEQGDINETAIRAGLGV